MKPNLYHEMVYDAEDLSAVLVKIATELSARRNAAVASIKLSADQRMVCEAYLSGLDFALDVIRQQRLLYDVHYEETKDDHPA